MCLAWAAAAPERAGLLGVLAATRRPNEAAVGYRHRLGALIMDLGLCSTLALLGAWVMGQDGSTDALRIW